MTWVILAVVLVAVAALTPRFGLVDHWRRRREVSLRIQTEDALKHILAWEQRGQNATPESLGGALGLGQNRVLPLLTRMESAVLIESSGGSLRLTPRGRSWALQVVRAHRLWERYLADDAGMPFSRLHQEAEKAEHQISPEKLAQLDAHLGHPVHDPHGDPIPRADGTLQAMPGVVLTDWAIGEAARIVHIEDEPQVIFEQILAADLRPGMSIRVLDKDNRRLVVMDEESGAEHRLARAVAANIHVGPVPPAPARPAGVRRLSELKAGEPAEVYELDARCRGFGRRRLLDLGLTPGARVEVALGNTFGDPRAFRVRGTMIALREQQAKLIWVRPLEAIEGAQERRGAVAAT